MAMDQDSIKHLEAVRKGKPRHFVLISKGVKILSLVVFHKGSLANKIKEAKEQGGGKVFSGTVVGSGQDIRFQLQAAEYDAPPGRELVLKDFLAAAEFKCQPTYEMVAELTPVPEIDADEMPARTGPSGSTPTTTSPTPPSSPPSSSPPPSSPGSSAIPAAPGVLTPEVEQLIAAMNKISGSIQQAAASHPDHRESLLKQVAGFRQHLKENAVSEAKAVLVQIAQLLKSLAGNVAAPEGTAASDDPQAAVYIECREIYAKARAKVKSNLERLEQVILTVCKMEEGYDPGEAAERAAAIYQVFDVLDERLLKVLDQAAAEPAQRERLQEEAMDLVDTYLNYATEDPFVTVLEGNGFVAVGVRRNMVDALSDLSRKL